MKVVSQSDIRNLTDEEREAIINQHYDGINPNNAEISNDPNLADQIAYIALYADGAAVEYNGIADISALVVTDDLIAVGML
jgi:hypothetical protein